MQGHRFVCTLWFISSARVIVSSGIAPAAGQTSSASAQSSDPQQLSEKLQRLEREMEELKGQISALQQSQKATAEIGRRVSVRKTFELQRRLQRERLSSAVLVQVRLEKDI
jgi:uncharacterized protein YlxW (UPF0749 family)